ncbi:MAG: radical SAM protein [Clostridia bacterium]
MKCDICPKECCVDRNESVGYCGVSNQIKIGWYGAHFGEEPIISGANGSGAIFFSGCNLKCKFCQNYEISKALNGYQISAKQLADIFKELEDKNVNNINLVTATHFLPQILQAFEIYMPKIPIVYNCSGYEKVESLKKLEGIVDIYLPDFKYSDNVLAQRLSCCNNYFEVCASAILEMKRQQPQSVVKGGVMQKGLIVRHLVLPNHLDNTFGVLEWLQRNLPNDYISVMSQYLPCGEAKNIADINRKLKPIEYKMVLNKIDKCGFELGFVQEMSSATTELIPNFYKGKSEV